MSGPDALETHLCALALHAQRWRTAPVPLSARITLWTCLARALRVCRLPEVLRLLRPCVPGACMPGGARIPGTSLELDPVQAAFALGVLVGWEDAPLPCAHAGPLLSVADYKARKARMEGHAPPSLLELLGALQTTHQIHAALLTCVPPTDDPTFLSKVAQTAVVTAMLEGTPAQIREAMSHAFMDGPALPLPACDRSRWQGADSAARAVQLALWTLAQGPRDEPLCASPPPSFAQADEDTPEALQQAIFQLTVAADALFLPRQAERIKALLAAPLPPLDTWPVSELMAQLVTHAPRELPPQLALLP